MEVLAETGSTNAVVAERARTGEQPGLVVVAEQQTAGRGRLDRHWESPARAGLTFSVLLAPPADHLSWVPLLGGLAVARAVREQTGVDAVLKWPNDVLAGDRKLAGVLAEAVGGLVVLGVGLNVTTRREELPVEQATSLALEQAETTDRDTLLRVVLRALGRGRAFGEPERAAYRGLCMTVGRRVRLALPGGKTVEGLAEEVDGQGRLVVDGVPYAAGDVVHLR